VSARAQAVRNTLFSSVGIYTEYLLGMLVSIVIARHLGPKSFGTYALAVWMVSLGVAATSSGSAAAVTKFVAELRGAGREDLIAPLLAYLRRRQLFYVLGVAIVGAGALFVAGDRIAPTLDHLVLYALLVTAVSLRAPYMFNVNVAKGFENFRATATIAAVATPVNLALATSAWLLDAPVEGFLTAYALSSAVFYLISRQQIGRFAPKATGAEEPLPAELLRRIRRHIRITTAGFTLSFFTASEMEVALLGMLDTVASAGQYKVGFQLASGASLLVPGVFAAILLPMMATSLSQGREVAVRRFSASTVYLALLSAPLIAFGLLLAHPTILFLYGTAYAAAVPVLAACLYSGSLSTIAQSAQSLLMSADHQHSMLMVSVACGILKTTLGVLLIMRFGLHGAVASCIIVASVYFTLYMTVGLRVSGARFPWARISRVVIAGVGACAIAYPLSRLTPPLAALLAGGATLALAYLFLTFVLGCWSRADIEYIKGLHRRIAADRPRALAGFLDWARTRAAEDFL
jgi:O-antigen/teichoic acid export membrane protein